MSWVDDTIKRVRDYGRSRPRSTQTAVGWSEVGGCRAALGFRLAGDFVTDDPDTWAAERGTALHEYLAPILAEPGDRVEMETEYRGIPGHADLVGPDYVTDLKTTTLATAKLWAADHSLLHPKLIQAHGYGAGLIDAGELPPDARVRLLVIPVDGKFADWWGYEEPFDRALADEGAGRLDEVRGLMARGEALPKDKPYAFCQDWCPFFSLCRTSDDPKAGEPITDPELIAAIATYGEATKQQTALKKQKDGLAGIIRGLRGSTPEWRISLGAGGDPAWELDEDWVRADYAARGEDVPVIEKPGSAPRMTVTRIKQKAAKTGGETDAT